MLMTHAQYTGSAERGFTYNIGLEARLCGSKANSSPSVLPKFIQTLSTVLLMAYKGQIFAFGL